ncbi:MAG: 30S ribosomal protein S7 [bacterium]|nr:30S ribosomal protein S7 [bacterium]
MRRKINIKRDIKPDIKYGSVLVSQFINKIMQDGEKRVAEKIFYTALANVEKKENKPGLEIFETAVKNVMPHLEVKSRRIGGANYQVPREVRGERKLTLAMRWLVTAARNGKGKSIDKKLAEEIILASKNEGNAIRKRNDTHRMAEANKAFAHFSW